MSDPGTRTRSSVRRYLSDLEANHGHSPGRQGSKVTVRTWTTAWYEAKSAALGVPVNEPARHPAGV